MKNVFDDPRFAPVRAAGAKLRDHHFGWIVDAAFEHFVERRGELHQAIVRLERFPDAERYNAYGEDTERTPAEHLAKRLEELAEVEGLVAFLRALQVLLNAMSAQRFGDAIGEMFRERAKAKP